MSLLNEEQLLVKNMVREFAEKELRPIAGEIDKTETFPMESVKRMAELNLLGLTTAKEYGGQGMDYVAYSLAIEELSRVCASHGIFLSVHISLCSGPIQYHGTEEQKQRFLPDLAAGRKVGAFCLTEPDAGTDSAAQKTTAEKNGDKYILNGTKIFITNGAFAETFLVFAMTDPSKGLKGISAFIVDKASPGFVVGSPFHKMGIRGSSQTEIIFKDCEVPAANLLGQEGEGFKIAMKTLDAGRIGVGSQALGIAQGAMEQAIDYAKERIQFGKPISSNQGIQWMLADMALKVEASRLLLHNAAKLKDAGEKFSMAAAMGKLHASETAMWVTTKAVQVHGGIGFTTALPIERFMRDAKITEIYEGTSEVQRIVIAANILK